ncbi:PDZ domain-containing protein [Haloferula sp. BvORR071]|uniref:S1C family serine protease n=1 Tax=Haloferula sp. BvORR071 TaxID=1396141 RepID=UPI0005590DCE|nr:PDZ domain-containing protein [Haloferula sp. BvORR071]
MAGAAQTLETTYRTNGQTVQSAFESVREVLQNSSAVIQRGNKELAYGTVMSANGVILTKASEVAEGEGLTVTIGTQVYKNPALLAVDKTWDVALLKIEATGLVPVKLATDLPDPERGTWVVANGASSRLKRRPQVGIIAANAREILPAGGVVLGITFKEKEEKKLVVEEVRGGSGAEAAGIKPGDVIVAAGGQDVTDHESLAKLFENRHAGEEMEIAVEREGKKITMQVKLAARMDLFPEAEEDKSRNDMMSGNFSSRRSNFPRVIQHDIIANASTIGGPLLDLDGRCLGMNIARANRCETFAIPAGDLKSLADRLMTQAQVK